MNTNTPTATMELMLRHRSVRKYSGAPITPQTLERILRCGQAAASSSFVQAVSVIRVTDPQARSRFAAAAGGQPWIEAAAEFLVWCADLHRVEQACRKAGAPQLEGHTEHSLVAIIDTALVAQNTLLAAESLGLGGVFIGGLRNQPALAVEICALPPKVLPLFGMCLGWPAEQTEVKPRLPTAVVLHQDQYRDSEWQSYDTAMAEYYRQRSDNAGQRTWSGETAKAMHGKKREHMLAFLRERGFFRR